ncbi:MAG: beta galactosidase jelly roll domain-containing protein [Bacteroidetes bacterium]|nr:beta galactosidase jelly roll domain-containing protein [Bacteroidota bacterium]
MFNKQLLPAILILCVTTAGAQDILTNVMGRKITSLNGKWHYIVDQYETGFYDYRFKERNPSDPEAYWNNPVQKDRSDRKEHGYNDKYSIKVPGDWNSQDAKFVYYEGTLWYQRTFDYQKQQKDNHLFIYFGAVNYKADVYLNGKKLGAHKGGFTPFQFEIPDSILQPKANFLVVKADNKRYADEVPTLNTDWWNYGGITRDVLLVEEPPVFIKAYTIQLHPPAAGEAFDANNMIIEGSVQLSQSTTQKVTVTIPEIQWHYDAVPDGNTVHFSFPVKNLQLWSPEKPKLYAVTVATGTEQIKDNIGFRTIQVIGQKIVLNGKPVFLRGISIHEEMAPEIRRAVNSADAKKLLGWAKELHCNMLRLAHYPHNEYMTRMADSLGLLVWSEIPVYWTIQFSNPEVLVKAKQQLADMIARDKNRASIIIWSVGNETPLSEPRLKFMSDLAQTAKRTDSTRLISAALEVHYNKDMNTIDDQLGNYTDIVAVNEYLGWYGGLPDNCRTAQWKTVFNKPLFFSETGAGAKGGFHADSLTRFSEEYQAWYFKETIAMMKRMPSNYTGLSPWLLVDFRSPRRNNPVYQEGWNRKGLIDQSGKKKKAFYVLRDYYEAMEKKAF